MTADPDRPVVVGVDGSLSSYSAVDWGVAAAQRRGAPLRLVHVVDRPGDDAPPDEITAAAQAYALACFAGAWVDSVDVTAEALRGEPASRLVDESTGAAVVVVGDRRLGGFRRLLAGSVGAQAAAHAHCPMVVVRPHVAPTPDDLDPCHGVGRVVVGVDGSELSRAALAFAFEEAALRGVGLTAVHTWRHPVAASTGDPLFTPYEPIGLGGHIGLADEEHQLLTWALAPFGECYPQVPVCPVSVPAVSPTAVLIHESGGAELLVVGSRGRGRFATLLLGSVSNPVIHRARCPVAVIRRCSRPHRVQVE